MTDTINGDLPQATLADWADFKPGDVFAYTPSADAYRWNPVEQRVADEPLDRDTQACRVDRIVTRHDITCIHATVLTGPESGHQVQVRIRH